MKRRRDIFGKLVLFVCLLLVFAVFSAYGRSAESEVKEITIALHDSPWLPGLKAILPLWEEETGIKIKLSIFPYNGLYEKLSTTIPAGGTEFDIIFLDDTWNALFQGGGYLTPLTDIEPGFTPDPEIISYAAAGRWNHEKNYSTEDGVLYGLPINGNFHLFYYREDLYKQAGLKTPPETWDDVKEAAAKLYDPGKPLYGYVLRGQKGNPVVFNWLPVLRSFNGDIFVDPPDDFTIRVNDSPAVEALETYLDFLNHAPRGSGDVGQAEMIGLLATGKAVQGIVVAAGAAAMDRDDFSIIPYKMQFAVTPKARDGKHAPLLGMWTMGIPKALTEERKKVGLEFMKWVTSKETQTKYTLAGAIPVRSDVLLADYPDKPEVRYLKAMGESYDLVTARPRMKEWFQLEDILGRYLNMAVIGDMSAKEALDGAAAEILAVMQEAGYNTGIKK